MCASSFAMTRASESPRLIGVLTRRECADDSSLVQNERQHTCFCRTYGTPGLRKWPLRCTLTATQRHHERHGAYMDVDMDTEMLQRSQDQSAPHQSGVAC